MLFKMLRSRIFAPITLTTLGFLVSTESLAKSNCQNDKPLNTQAFQDIAQKCATNELLQKLKDAGFQCEQLQCRGNIRAYSEPVIIMIPDRWEPQAGFHFHFHGFNSAGDQTREAVHFNKKSGDGDYLKFANQGGLKSLMIFPLSKGKCQTFNSEILNYESLNKISEELSQVTTVNPNRWSLSFHSGADSTANRLLKDSAIDKKLIGVALFDSLYAQRSGIKEGFTRLEIKDPAPVLRSYYVPNTSPDTHNQWLKKGLNKTEFIGAKKTTHMGIMSYGMADFFKKISE